MLCQPRVRVDVLHVAVLLLPLPDSGTLAQPLIVVESARNATVPSGCGAFTVAVNVTVCPTILGLRSDVSEVVLEAICTRNGAESDGLSASPAMADAVMMTSDSAFEYVPPSIQHVVDPWGIVQFKPPPRTPVPARSERAMVVALDTACGFPRSS